MKGKGQREKEKQQQHPGQVSPLLKWQQLWPSSTKNEGISADKGLAEEKQTEALGSAGVEGRKEGGLEGGDSTSSGICISCGRTSEGEGQAGV